MKILGLDIGTYSIKAMELDVSFGRIELVDYAIEPVAEPAPKAAPVREDAEPAVSPESPSATPSGAAAAPAKEVRKIISAEQISALRNVIGSKHFSYERVVVNFPKGWTTSRTFSYPTKDRKTIQNSLTYELDDEIPFPIDDIIFDFAILEYTGTTSTVFTTVALKTDITELLSELQLMGIDPDIVTVESWASNILMSKALPREFEGKPVCLVNIGHKQTQIHMIAPHAPLVTHVSACAGDDITRAIAKVYNLTYVEAEKAKLDGAYLLTELHLSGQAGGEPITEEQKLFAGTIADSIAPMIRELKQTLMWYKSQHKIAPEAILITGGSSLLMNIGLYLEEQLSIPVFPLKYISRIVGQTLQLDESNEAPLSTAASLAVTGVKIDRNFSINFRKDDFSKRGGIGALNLSAYRRPLKFLAASIAFVLVNLIIQGVILSSRLQSQDARFERAIKGVIGAVNSSQMLIYKSSPSTLKTAVKKELEKYKETKTVAKKGQISAFDVLNKVSQAMPRDMTLDVTTFEVKQGNFKMTGVVDQLTNPQRIMKALEDTRLLVDVAKQKADEDPKTRKVRFELTAKVAEAGNVKTR